VASRSAVASFAAVQGDHRPNRVADHLALADDYLFGESPSLNRIAQSPRPTPRTKNLPMHETKW